MGHRFSQTILRHVSVHRLIGTALQPISLMIYADGGGMADLYIKILPCSHVLLVMGIGNQVIHRAPAATLLPLVILYLMVMKGF